MAQLVCLCLRGVRLGLKGPRLSTCETALSHAFIAALRSGRNAAMPVTLSGLDDAHEVRRHLGNAPLGCAQQMDSITSCFAPRTARRCAPSSGRKGAHAQRAAHASHSTQQRQPALDLRAAAATVNAPLAEVLAVVRPEAVAVFAYAGARARHDRFGGEP